MASRPEAFANFYVGKAAYNGTEAARLAGYTGTDASLAATASRLLRTDKVRTLLAAHDENMMRRGMRVRENRIRRREAKLAEIEKIREERAADPTIAGLPGVDTGWIYPTLVRMWRHDAGTPDETVTGADGVARTVHGRAPADIGESVMYGLVDTALMREEDEILKHLAIEAGEWTEKQEIGVRGAAPGVEIMTVTVLRPVASEEDLGDADGDEDDDDTEEDLGE